METDVRMLLEHCIEMGLERGWRQAHKHVENPTQGGMVTAMQDAIWLEIDTYFHFKNHNND